MSFSNDSVGQDYLREFDIKIPDVENTWDSISIAKLGIKSIDDSRSKILFEFYPNGRLKSYLRYDDFLWNQFKIEYFPNGNKKQYCSYLGNCGDIYVNKTKYPNPFCYTFFTNPLDLDTSTCTLYKSAEVFGTETVFWKRKLVIKETEIWIWFQMNSKGEIFFLKWGLTEDSGEGKWNYSGIKDRIIFDEFGNIIEIVKFEVNGGEWFGNSDTVFYVANEFHRGVLVNAKTKYWASYYEFDNPTVIYECFDSDGEMGVDTCYYTTAYLKKQDYINPIHGFASSFQYNFEKKLIITNTYLLDSWHLYDCIGWDCSIFLDTINLSNQTIYEFYVDNYKIISESYGENQSKRVEIHLDYNHIRISEKHYVLEHEKDSFKIKKDWHLEPQVIITEYLSDAIVTSPIRKLSKKDIKQRVFNLTEKLKDTSLYSVAYFE